jgi:hypothetical protein
MSMQRPVFKKNLQVIFIFVSMLSMASCADKIKTDLIAYEALDEGLMNSNRSIGIGTTLAFTTLENKLADPAMGEKAKVWMSKATVVRELSKEMIRYIEGLRSELRAEAGGESFRKADKKSVVHMFEKKKKGVELYQHLKTYRDGMLAIDPSIKETFSQNTV